MVNDELIDDLRNMIGVYKELKGHLIDGFIEKTNNNLMVSL